MFKSKKISNNQELKQSDPISCFKIKREITKYINWQQFTKGTRGKPNEQLFPRQVVIQLPKYVTHLIGERKYQYEQQEQVTVRNHHHGKQLDRVKRIWYLSPMRAAKVQASLRIRAVTLEPSLLAHTSSESRGTLRQKARSLAQLNGWACAVEICHDGMHEDTNSLDAAKLNHG